MPDGLVAGEQPKEVALAGTVAAEHGDALAEPQLEVERIGQPVELDLLDDHRPLARAGAAEAHVDALLANVRRAFGTPLELSQPALRRLQLGRELVGHLRPPAHLDDDGVQPLALVVVPRAVTTELVVTRPPRLGVAAEAAAMGPCALRLDRHDLRRRGRQQLAIVAHVEDGLAGVAELALEPPLAVHVEEVVRLVEQEDVVLAAQQHLQRDALLLAARERSQRPGRGFLERDPDGSREALVPMDLGVVATVLAPVGEGVGVLHRVLVGGALRVGEPPRRRAQRRRSQRDEQLARRQRRVGHPIGDADELAHHADVPVDRQRAGRR